MIPSPSQHWAGRGSTPIPLPHLQVITQSLRESPESRTPGASLLHGRGHRNKNQRNLEGLSCACVGELPTQCPKVEVSLGLPSDHLEAFSSVPGRSASIESPTGGTT